MTELIQVSKGVYVLSGPVNTGLILGETGLIVVDTGFDAQWAKLIIKCAEKLERPVSAVINTHAHVDHVGGNHYLVQQTGAKVYAHVLEEFRIKNPVMGAVTLFGGAKPVDELAAMFHQVAPSQVDGLLTPGKISLDGIDLEIVPLFGHTHGQCGVVREGCLFFSDSLYVGRTLKGHGIPYLVDLGLALETLKYLGQSAFEAYVPGHGRVRESIDHFIPTNFELLDRLKADISDELKQPAPASRIIHVLVERYQIAVRSVSHYYMIRATVHAFLSYLHTTGQVGMTHREGEMLWYSI